MNAYPHTATHVVECSPGLECRVGGRRVAIPMRHVDQLIEYERSPLPLAKSGVAGLGLHQGQLVLSLALPFASPARASGPTKGVSLRGFPLGLLWALEVDQTFGFIEVSATELRADLAAWTRDALDGRGEPLLELDVATLLDALQLPRVD
jgi:CheW-like domain